MTRCEENRKAQRILGVGLCLALGLSGLAYAGGGSGKGKGSGDPGDGSSGGITPVTITFADGSGDRIRSDTGTPYTDGLEGVEAFLGSKANYGNVWLRLANSTRGLWLDFTDCVTTGGCSPPFVSDVNDLSAIKVDADNVQQDGLFGMAIGATIYAPMRVYYQLDSTDAPGFIDFDPSLSGKSPCKNKSVKVEVTRIDAKAWEVRGDVTPLACVTLPDGSSGGQFDMPFEFTVEVLP